MAFKKLEVIQSVKILLVSFLNILSQFVNSPLEVFLQKVVLKIFSKFTGEHPCRSMISTKLFCNFNEIALRHGYSPVNLLHIFTALLPKSTSGELILSINHIVPVFIFYAFLIILDRSFFLQPGKDVGSCSF